MDKRTETAFVFDGTGKQTQKHVLLWPGAGVYFPAEDSWVKTDNQSPMPSRLYSYAGGAMILPWDFDGEKWATTMTFNIDKGGVLADPEMIEGHPKESIRVFGHCGNAILVISWPDTSLKTIYIFDHNSRQLTTALYPWSLGYEPPIPFVRHIDGPMLKISPRGIELVINKGNKLKTSINIGLPTTMDQEEELPLLALTF